MERGLIQLPAMRRPVAIAQQSHAGLSVPYLPRQACRPRQKWIALFHTSAWLHGGVVSVQEIVYFIMQVSRIGAMGRCQWTLEE